MRDFQPASHVFQGVIGGPPCQDFSKARRCPPTGYGLKMLAEFCRVVTTASPDWFLSENVPGVPDIQIPGYRVQRLNLNASECGLPQNRLRCFQFGSRDGVGLVIPRFAAPDKVMRCALASEGRKSTRRAFADFCELQGLPRDFSLPGLSQSLRYQLVGNGVPVPMARVVATAIARRHATCHVRVCACGCGRPVHPGQTRATPACRKRIQRRRDAIAVTRPGLITPAASK